MSYGYTNTWFYCIQKRDDIAEDAEARFDTSNYELDRLWPKRENKKAIGLMKNKLAGKIMIKTYRIKSKNL